MNYWRKIAAVVCLSIALSINAFGQTNSLAWHKADGLVDADVHSETLLPLLRGIAGQTGWHIFVEPGTSHTASTKFKNLPTGDALKRLLGDLNFALVPKDNGPSELYVFVTTMKNATRQVVAAKPPRHVPNELLVKVKSGTDIKALAKILNAKVTGEIDKYGVYQLQFADANAADAALSQLQNNSDVQAVDYNNYFDPPPTPQSVQAGAGAASPLSLQPSPPSSNGKVVVALIDTSVDVQSLGPDAAQFILPPINVGNGTSSDSSPTHGTAMAGTLLGTIQNIQSTMGNDSTSVQIQPINVYGASGEQTTSWDVLNGLEQAAKAGDPIINMSLGSSGDSPILDQFASQMATEGYTIFAAAGNTPTGDPYYPAADSGVHAVTAFSMPGQLASYANTWPDPTMIALPGTSVFNFNGQPWAVSGTSTSTVEATGVYATYAANGWSQSQIFPAMLKKFPVPAQ